MSPARKRIDTAMDVLTVTAYAGGTVALLVALPWAVLSDVYGEVDAAAAWTLGISVLLLLASGIAMVWLMFLEDLLEKREEGR